MSAAAFRDGRRVGRKKEKESALTVLVLGSWSSHIAQIIELVGPFPRKVALAGKYSAEIFNRKGESSISHFDERRGGNSRR